MDRINASNPPASSFPINQALRAYAQSPKLNRPGGSPYANQVQRIRQTPPISTVVPAQETQSTQSSRQTDTIGKIVPDRSTQRAASINQLISAKVEPINLSADVTPIAGPKPVTTSAGTYTMYPQAADRNQAATNHAYNSSLGRSLDLRG